MAIKSSILTVKIPTAAMHDRLRDAAKVRRMSVSGAVREAIWAWLQEGDPEEQEVTPK